MKDEDRYTKMSLRLPKETHQKLALAADSLSRSTNAEVVARLEESLARDSAGPPDAPAKVLTLQDVEALLDRKLLNLVMALNAPAHGRDQAKE